MTDEPEDTRPLVDVVISAHGVSLQVGQLPFTPTFSAKDAIGLGKRLKAGATLWEKHYRAFVHDETDTVH